MAATVPRCQPCSHRVEIGDDIVVFVREGEVLTDEEADALRSFILSQRRERRVADHEAQQN